jgi:hypothetical protein
MNKNEKIHEWIDRFNDNELTGDELSEFLELLKVDEALKAEVRLDKDLNKFLQDEGEMSFRNKIIEVSKSRENKGSAIRIILLAASITLIVVLAVILYLVVGVKPRTDRNLRTNINTENRIPATEKSAPGLNNGMTITINQQSGADSLSKTGLRTGKQNQLLLASGYTPFPPFESLVGTQVRSGFFRLIEPHSGSQFKTKCTIPFSWETDSSHPLALVIMDNQGQLVFDSHPFRGKSIKLPSGKLKNGLFYFKILKDDEMLYFGKFTIEINNF